MTTGTADTVRKVRRAHEICMAFALLVARETSFARLLRAQSRKSDDLRGIATGINVRLPGAMAGLAALPLRAFLLAGFGSPMRPVIVARSLWLMARLAGVGADVERRILRLVYGIHILLWLVSQQRGRQKHNGKKNYGARDSVRLAQGSLGLLAIAPL